MGRRRRGKNVGTVAERNHENTREDLQENEAGRGEDEDIEENNNTTSNILSQNKRDNYFKKTTPLNFIITNARSLWGKIKSAFDYFTELELHCAIICETWFYDCPAFDNLKRDARLGSSIEMINYVRKRKGNKNKGGGVSILFNRLKISLKKFAVKTKGFEFVIGRGKIPNNTRPVFIIGAYISTRLKKKEVEDMIECIGMAVLKIKTEASSPYIIIGGDFNRADFTQLLTDYPDLCVSPSPPTRGNAVLDLALTNFRDEIQATQIRQPLHNEEAETVSDHLVVHYEANLRHIHEFRRIKQKYRPMSNEKIEAAVRRIKMTVWEEVLPTMSNPDEYVAAFHKYIVEVCEEEIPWKSTWVKSTDEPWVTDALRRQVKKRQGIFREQGRIGAWKDFKKLTRRMTRNAKKSFYDDQVEKMKTPGVLPFKAIKRLKDGEAKEQWEIQALFPGRGDEEILEETATYFSAISQEFEDVRLEDIPPAPMRTLPLLDVEYVSECMKNMKKPTSYISIDIPPAVVNQSTAALSTALAPVYNLMRRSEWWPSLWKTEEVSIIPKVANPESLDQTRNISCTSMFSKLGEEFMLMELHKEVSLSERQFGGKRGCGTEHLLAEMSTDIVEALEDNRNCVALMSLDYSKAFNRMNHAHCIRNLAKKGATTQVLKMVYAFLSNRSMKIKISGKFSQPTRTPGGAPQGTKSGNFLFSIATDDLNRDPTDVLETDSFSMENSNNENTSGCDESNTRYDQTADFSFNVARYDGRLTRKGNPLDETAPHQLLQAWDRNQIEATLGGPVNCRKRPMITYKYVDDQTVLEVCPISLAVSSISTGKEKRFVHMTGLSDEYTYTERAAGDLGMKLNLNKTQVLCISEAKNYVINAYLNVNNSIIEGTESMKVLGYILDTTTGASAQVRDIIGKTANRSWSIRHLIRAGVGQTHLVQIYAAFVRSAIEYGSNVYGGYLTKLQEEMIERLQANILKSIYGLRVSYRTCLVLANLPTLKKRRELIFARFARRIECTKEFRERWLPVNEDVEYNLRVRDKYRIDKANCERLKKTPIHRIRALLNGLHREGRNINEEIMRIEEKILDYDDNEPHITFIE